MKFIKRITTAIMDYLALLCVFLFVFYYWAFGLLVFDIASPSVEIVAITISLLLMALVLFGILATAVEKVMKKMCLLNKD